MRADQPARRKNHRAATEQNAWSRRSRFSVVCIINPTSNSSPVLSQARPRWKQSPEKNYLQRATTSREETIAQDPPDGIPVARSVRSGTQHQSGSGLDRRRVRENVDVRRGLRVGVGVSLRRRETLHALTSAATWRGLSREANPVLLQAQPRGKASPEKNHLQRGKTIGIAPPKRIPVARSVRSGTAQQRGSESGRSCVCEDADVWRGLRVGVSVALRLRKTSTLSRARLHGAASHAKQTPCFYKHSHGTDPCSPLREERDRATARLRRADSHAPYPRLKPASDWTSEVRIRRARRGACAPVFRRRTA
jgi:hypothetical protein